MMITVRIIQQFLFIIFILYTFFGILQFLLRHKLPLNYFLAALFISGGYVFFYYWAFSLGIIKNIPFLFNSELPTGYIIGPFFYLYYCSISGVKIRLKYFLCLHFIPFFIACGLITLINRSAPLSALSGENLPFLLPDYSWNRYLPLISIGSDVSLGTYYLLTLVRVSIFFHKRKFTKEIILLHIFLLLMPASQMVLVVAGIFQLEGLMLFGLGGFALLPLYYIFFSFRFPGFSLRVLKEARGIRYERSITTGLDVDIVLERLTELMSEEKIFMSTDLTLETLSSLLKIPGHQLSRILNDRLNKNFNNYINEFRIEEAKRQLLKFKEKPILDIAFSVGFNSKSPFYTAFVKETGLSPSEYRKKFLQVARNSR